MKISKARLYHIISGIILSAFLALAIASIAPDETPFDKITSWHSDYLAARLLQAIFGIAFAYNLFKMFFFVFLPNRLIWTVDTLLITYFSVELVFSSTGFFTSGGTYAVVTKNTFTADSLSGYRYTPGIHQQAYIYNGQQIYNTRFAVNKQGFVAKNDYSFTKPKNKKRYLILGDSFTSAAFNDTNWPKQLTDLAAADTSCEYFSFSLEGIGALAWYNMFFKEIVPNYEFDGVILPVYYEDVFRRHVVLAETEGKVKVVFTDSLPADATGGTALAGCLEPGTINAAVDSLKMQTGRASLPRLRLTNNYILPAATALVFAVKKIRSSSTHEDFDANINYINKSKEGRNGLDKITAIVEYSKQQHKEVIILSIPDIYVADFYQGHKIINDEICVKAIANKLEVPYFSGYECFKDVSQKDIQKYFLPDGHWNSTGSQLFAVKFFKFQADKCNVTKTN